MHKTLKSINLTPFQMFLCRVTLISKFMIEHIDMLCSITKMFYLKLIWWSMIYLYVHRALFGLSICSKYTNLMKFDHKMKI